MRCVIARFPFDLTKSGVLESMRGIKPERVSGESVIIGRRTYPVKQVGQVITRQDRRDFSASEVLRAMSRLGFTCTGRAATAATAVPERALVAPRRVLSPFQQASALLGGPAAA
ncbi:SCO5918 family protein [Streptomyces griseus]|uniref:SCO5918 family protein n=1 Tax=Streptomyces TaxID=1883 RepID=UPI0029C1D82C|nr:SCO5918 family protein [Streptomyces sp. ID01-9D]MDX5575010.1 SCO5918 family protein [Streptomyces sp. ID01-9D]WTC86393.1 SCO5918 family protein [Streptomyces griseus]WTD70989.1 SCO5918 family protein [Streptomyces griseus]